MRFEKGHKEATRQRIVEVAAERFRKDGIAAVGIAGLMADAGLTHGGFYAHFGSKEELVREAMGAALDRTQKRIEAAGLNEAGLENYIRFYLRTAHRDHPERGCAAAALGAEIGRQGEATRATFTEKFSEIIARIAARLPEGTPTEQAQSTAIAIFGLLSGTLQLARAVADPELSDRILESGIQGALRLAE